MSHLITSKYALEFQTHIIINRNVDVELGFERENLLFVGGHAAPNNINDRIIKLEVLRQPPLAQFRWYVHFLILLDI